MDDAIGASTSDAELARLASVNLNLLVPLLALLEERSVTRAAARVGLSQPAMSHALNRMRALLGDEIIVRQGNGMALTPRAVELFVPLKHALHHTARVVSPSSFDPAVDRRVITIAMTSSTALVIGSAISSILARQAPHAELRILTTGATTPTVFTDDGVDVVLLSEAFASPFPRERLYDDRWVVVAPAGAGRGRSGMELVTTLPHVIFNGMPQRILPYTILDAENVPYTVRTLVSDNLALLPLAAGSNCAAIHRYRVAYAFSEHLNLVIEEFPFPVHSLGIDMVWNPRLADLQFRSWLREILVEAAGKLPGG